MSSCVGSILKDFRSGSDWRLADKSVDATPPNNHGFLRSWSWRGHSNLRPGRDLEFRDVSKSRPVLLFNFCELSINTAQGSIANTRMGRASQDGHP